MRTDLDRGFDDNVYDLNAILHPGSVFDSPQDVLADPTLSRAEKRAILASWASDASSVQDEPTLRWLLGTPEPDVRDALLRLECRHN